MAYTPSNSNVEPSDCGEWTFGEVEDYCVTLDGPVGIFEKKQQPFVVFPNPANDNFTLVTTAEFLNVPLQYRLINMHGQLIQSSQIFSGQTLDCSNLESGIYFIEIRSGENTSHVRLIKN
jgi:hypothetical protein